MIEQINIALDQKGSGNFSAWVIEACRRRLCSEKRVSPEANKEKSDITELLRKQVRPDWSNLDNRADYAPHINVSHYIYYLATENIHLVLENDNTVLIKGQGKVVNVRFSKNKCLIEATLKGFKSGELSFYEYRKNLATAGVFRWITNIHENKRYYYTFDNSLLFTENIQNTTQIFPH